MSKKKKKKITKNPYRSEENQQGSGMTTAVVVNEQEENTTAKKISYGACALFFGLGLLFMLISTKHGYGTDLWARYDAMSYGSVAIGGLILAYSARFTIKEKQIKMQTIGLVMFMIATARLLTIWLM